MQASLIRSTAEYLLGSTVSSDWFLVQIFRTTTTKHGHADCDRTVRSTATIWPSRLRDTRSARQWVQVESVSTSQTEYYVL